MSNARSQFFSGVQPGNRKKNIVVAEFQLKNLLWFQKLRVMPNPYVITHAGNRSICSVPHSTFYQGRFTRISHTLPITFCKVNS